MTYQNKIYFFSAPLGQYSIWILENLEKLVGVNPNRNRIHFKFGTPGRLDIDTGVPPYERMSLVLRDQLSNFENTDFIYYGWEIIYCLEDLRRDYPDAEFFLILSNSDHAKERGMLGHLKFNSREFLLNKMSEQEILIRNFLENKNAIEQLREKKDPSGFIVESISTYHLKPNV